MSPEQICGESHRVNARSDIYSLGVVAYELLTGRLPFKARELDDLRKQILSGEPRPPRTIDDAIPPELETVCLKAMAKDPAQRYSTAKDMAAELREAQTLLAGASAVPTAASPAKDARTGRRRAQFLVVAGAALIMVIVGLVGTFTGGFFGGPRRPDPPPADDPVAPRIAVLYFESQASETGDMAAFEKGLCSMMIDQIKQFTKTNYQPRISTRAVKDQCNGCFLNGYGWSPMVRSISRPIRANST